MNILVTGASGFLGGRAALRLAEDHGVIGVGRQFNDAHRAQLEAAGVELHLIDLTTEHVLLQPLLDGVDVVVHCAAMSTLWGRWEDLHRINVAATSLLAQDCKTRDIRLVHISSPSIYNRAIHDGASWGTPERPVPETLPVGPRFDSDYARSKWLAEEEVRAHLPESCILRPRGIYGPGDTSILPRVIRALKARRLPRLTSDEVWTHLTHVDNAVHAIVLAVTSGASGPFNIADPQPLPIWSSIDGVADALGVPRPRLRVPAAAVERAAAAVEFLARRLPGRPEPTLTATGVRLLTTPLHLDLTRAHELLGYEPVHTEGFASVVQELG